MPNLRPACELRQFSRHPYEIAVEPADCTRTFRGSATVPARSAGQHDVVLTVAPVGVPPTESPCPGENMRPRMSRLAPPPTASLFNILNSPFSRALADRFSTLQHDLIKGRQSNLAPSRRRVTLPPVSDSPSSTAPESTPTAGSPAASPIFATTHWSVVLSAARNDTTRARNALAFLCETYWPALYAFVRRRGFPPQDAEDLTQEFFARLLQHNWVARADARKGRFRTFLLTALNRFLAGEWDKARAQKRGGGHQPMSLDSEAGDPADPAGALAADLIYDRDWALALLERTMARLRAEFAQAGKAREFAHFKPFLTVARMEIPYAEAAAAAGLSEGAARVAVHRLRKRYRELFREEIARTVADPAEVDAELRHLIAVLARQ